MAYNASFPRGIHALKANFYLAQAYFAEDKKDKSIANYTYVTNLEVSLQSNLWLDCLRFCLIVNLMTKRFLS
jgi:hypothetical protein